MNQEDDEYSSSQKSMKQYFSREFQIKSTLEAQSNFIKANKESLSNIHSPIIIDSSNKPSNLINAIDCKFHIQSSECKNQKQIIINPYIDIGQSEQLEDLSAMPFLPVAQTDFFEEEINTPILIFNYILKNIQNEKDVLIYCADLNQMELLRLLLDGLARIKPIINQELTALYEQLFQDSRSYKNTIYLLLEPQYLPSEQITLIVHCPTKQIIRAGEQHSISTTTVQLSQTELCIREIPKSNTLGVKILYAFTEQTYLQLPIKPQNYDTSFCSFHENNQQLAIIIAVLQTPGSLLIDKSNINFTVRTSPYWSKLGDGISWINIITHLSTRVQRILDSEDTQEYSRELQKWCSQNVINVLKGLLVILKMEEFAEQMNHPELALIQSLNSMPQLQKQASSINERVDEKSLELLLKDHFPKIVRSEPKLYTYKGDLLPLRNNNIQRLISHYLSDAYLLGLKDGEIEFMNNISSRKASFNQKEYTLVNIGNAIMNELWKNEGIEIYRFEEQNNCTVDPNLELNLISVYSDQNVEIKNLEDLIEQTRNNLANETQEVAFHADTKFIVGSGGIILNWIKADQSMGFMMTNLPENVTIAEIREYFDDFTEILQIKIKKLLNSCQAQITIADKEDLPYIVEEFDQMEFRDNIIRIETMQQSIQNRIDQPKAFNSYLLELTWFMKQSKGTAIIVLNNNEFATRAHTLLNRQDVDGNVVRVSFIDQVTLKFENLHPLTNELDLMKFCGGSEAVKYISMDYKQIQEARGDQGQKILNLVKMKLNHKAGIEIVQIKKKQEGRRVAKISIPGVKLLDEALGSIHNSLIAIGNNFAKVHCRPLYKQKFLIPKILKQIVESELNATKFKVKSRFQEVQSVNQENSIETEITLTITCYQELIFNKTCQIIYQIKEGIKININEKNIDAVFSPIGKTKIREIKQSFEDVEFITDPAKKTIKVYCVKDQFPLIQKQFDEFLEKTVSHKIQIPPSAIKSLIGIDGQGLEQFKNQFDLSSIKYNQFTKEIILEGSAITVDTARSAFLNTISEIQLKNINPQFTVKTCGFCMDDLKQGYLLQNCGHKFCLECIIYSLTNSVNDVNSLPIVCPECKKNLILEDIIMILGQDQYKRLIEVATNKYVQDNIKEISFCFTTDCPNIVKISEPTYYCQVCTKEYCTACKALRHPGLTCEENRIGDFILLQRLMEKEDIRRCPNCKTLAQHVSGCFRVQCNACKKHICWKKKKDGTPCMEFYNESSQCYEHLNKIHGGYF